MRTSATPNLFLAPHLDRSVPYPRLARLLFISTTSSRQRCRRVQGKYLAGLDRPAQHPPGRRGARTTRQWIRGKNEMYTTAVAKCTQINARPRSFSFAEMDRTVQYCSSTIPTVSSAQRLLATLLMMTGVYSEIMLRPRFFDHK